MPPPVRWPIVAKLSLLALTVSIIPITIVSLIGASRGLKAVEETALRNIELIAVGVAQQLDQLIDDASSMVNVISADELMIELCAAPPDEAEELRDAVIRRLELLVNSNPDFASAFVTDAEGIGLASTNPKNIGMPLNFREYWQEASKGNTHVSGLLIGKTTGKPGIYFSQPVIDESLNIVGVAVLKFDGEAIWRLIGEQRVSEQGTNQTGFATILDEHGILLAAPARENIFKSLGPLTEEQIAEIDPDRRWGIATIEHLDYPELMKPLISPASQGNIRVARRGIADPFIVGYAPMSQKDWTVAVVEPRSEFDTPIRRLRRQQIGTVAGIAFLAAVFALVQARNLARPIRILDEAAQRIAGGDFETRVKVGTHDEIGRLARTFNDMAPRLAEQVKMSEALSVAREVQRNLLPKAPPTVDGFDLAGRSIPADQTGGDYYDFLDMSEHRDKTVGIVIGDVTGHGVAAALLMATARAVLRSGASPFDDLSRLASTVNERLVLDTDSGRFMTLFYMVLDAAERRARWISAGHDPAFVYLLDDDQFEEYAGEDIPLGIERSWVFSEEAREGIAPGTLIVIGTDGIWEARNPAGDMYGKDRLRDVIRAHSSKPCQDVVEAIIADVQAYIAGGEQQDDITCVAVRMH